MAEMLFLNLCETLKVKHKHRTHMLHILGTYVSIGGGVHF